MARYTPESKDRVRDAVDMVDLVSARVDLRRAGPSRYEGLCPFHDERTPSFGINPAEKVYHCFGCKASGDVFTFVMETEAVDFKGALELLADRYGVELELEDEDPQVAARRKRRERLYALLERAAAYYERYLWESDEAAAARAYLTERGFGEPVLREFRVGYAPSAWDKLMVGSLRAGFTEEELYAAGLGQRSRERGTLYDRFRGRVMFPLADQRGRVLGFGARALRDNQQPKYLNTSDGEVYHKGRQLFGADRARAHAAKAGAVIVVEGYTDVLALHQAGLHNAVGLMGTALTDEQVAELARLAPRVELALDADSAGREAMLRAAKGAAGRKLELRVVPMPAGTDPAELVLRDGADAVTALVAGSVPFVRFRIERSLASGDLGSAEGRDRVLEEVREVLAAIPRGTLREELTRLVADRLDLSADLVASLVAAAPAPAASATDGTTAVAVAPRGARAVLDRRERTERQFLALCIALPEQGREALRGVREEEHFTGELVRRAARHLRPRLATPLADLPPGDEELAALISELVVEAGRAPATAETLQVEGLQLEKARLEREIASARADGRLEVGRLATEREDVLRRLREWGSGV